MASSSNPLKKLCYHVTGVEDERLNQHYQLAVDLLSQGTGHVLDDCNTVADMIKRHMVREKRLEDAARFEGLFNKIQQSSVLRNKASVLTVFLLLSKSKSNQNYENGLSNGHCGEDLMEHHITSPIDPEINFGGGSRVARLAAMYKDAGIAGKNQAQNYKRQALVTTPTTPTTPSLPTNRVCPPPDRLQGPLSPRKIKLSKDSLSEVTQDALIREILYIFQGIEGRLIKIDVSKDGFKIDPKIRLSCSQQQLILKLAEVGWLYNQIKKFCEAHGGSTTNYTGDRAASGLVNQSLVMALREDLTEYCRLIAVLEAQVHEGKDSPFGDERGGLTLRKLLLWTLEPRFRLQGMALLTHSAREVKGGATVSALYQHLHHGDPAHYTMVKHALSLACTPLFMMLTQWLLDGQLEDSYHEFFIAADPTVSDEKLWQDKYSLRYSMLPSFISAQQAHKVLATGKSLNFLRNVCQVRAPIAARETIKKALQQTTVESLFSQDENIQLDHLINLTFRETSRHVLDEILQQHKLVQHLRAMRRYLLLGQGDFIHYLMEVLEPVLCKPASNLLPHNLSSMLETAIAASNAQYEEPDILNRLDVRLLERSPGDTGWDVFSLDYRVDGPIGTVITSDCIRQYLMLFNALWRAKRMEWILSGTWKKQAATAKICRDLPEMNGILHSVQLLTNEMVHLIQQMAYYMTFEVLECSWHNLMTRLKSAQSLDDVIAAHEKFLKTILAGALLDAQSQDVRTHLRTLYDMMLKLEVLQERLYTAVVNEMDLRRAALAEIEEKTKAGGFGTSAEQQEKERKRKKDFSSKVVAKMKTELKILSQTYQDMVQSFLLMLTQHEDENLHLLSTRLDFNEHYHKRDHRLNLRMTYHHKRKSMVLL
ncbi:gamma-tubulin complex component 3 homolog isoform X2 [Oratosquilla oratoria]|uniref:gamma-tubulin complex component 3 homolog isoform X2 n=1 Tax=Oratosquilla oratoria TaxID=337810 RepID=UPI003F774162